MESSPELDAPAQINPSETPTETTEVEISGQESETTTEVETQAEGQEQVTEQAQPETEIADTIPRERFNQVYYQNKQRERELETLRAQVQQQTPVQAPVTQVKPTLDQFDYDEGQFQEALVDYKLDQRDQLAKANQETQAIQAKTQSFRQKQDPYMSTNIEYSNLVHQAEMAGVEFTDTVAEVIMDSEVGVKIHHHLLANPGKLDSLQQLSPVQQVREIVKLENKFNTKAKPAKKSANVINPVNSASSTGGNLTPTGKSTPAEYYKARMAEIAASK